jgi:ribosome-associated protein
MLWISPQIQIPLTEIEFSYVRSSGPGGQNVNKVNSKAVLRWNLIESPSLNEDLRLRLLSRLGPQLTRDGDVLLASDRFRDQGRNREDCLEKLRQLLLRASHVPKARKKTKPTKSSQRKAREKKSHHSEKKRFRSGRYDD